MFFILYKLLTLPIRIIGFKKSVVLAIALYIFLPQYADAQFYTRGAIAFEVSGSYEVRQNYVNPYVQQTPFYAVKLSHWIFFYEGLPPLIYKAGFFFEENRKIDSRIISRFELYNQTTLGRPILEETSNAYYVAPENYAGISYRQRIWSDFIAVEIDGKQDLQLNDSHGGGHVAVGAIFRFLQLPKSSFYFTRYLNYGDENYNYGWYSTDEDIDNNEIRAGIYETVDTLTITNKLSKRQFIDFEIIRARALNTVATSYAVVNKKDNGIKITYGLRF